MNLFIKYVFFSIVSVLANLFTQYICLSYISDNLYIGMLMGTLTGLFTKYFLDKLYIFNYVTTGKADDIKKFTLYSFMGIFTTSIFWSFELSFNLMFESTIAKYLGGLLGLSIGYSFKYLLDKKFVFNSKEIFTIKNTR